MLNIKKNLATATFSLILLFSSQLFANTNCKTDNIASAHPPLETNSNIQIEFNISDIPEEGSTDAYPISVSARNCLTNESRKISTLPYLGDPGKIESAFILNEKKYNKKRLYIIQSTAITSDTGISYNSDFFTVSVFDEKTEMEYSLNKKLSDFFGSGGDVATQEDSDFIDYSYPYKTKRAIEETLMSRGFKNWSLNKPSKAKVIDKVFIYEYPSIADKTPKYLIQNDIIVVNDQASGWLKISYKTARSGIIEGWIPCSKTEICESNQNTSKTHQKTASHK
ncbi:hypothetical protein WG219_20865 [Ectopseudomonas mendocina]|uniref:SH3b domain-containing protein n=1 Tax=Ectopseudomonas mendocina TaxID=300 RepID=A0ABZ2RM19_ECTME